MSCTRAGLITGVVVILTWCTPTVADDAVVNTPTIIGNLRGEWELQPKVKDAYKQRLSFTSPQCGEWQQSKETLPVSITFYVEGGELLLQHYYEPTKAFNYRLKQLRYGYKLDGETLTLTRDGTSETWKRISKQERK
jgi:hypothetical protein